MTLPIYPTVRGLTWPVMKSSMESTLTQTGPGGSTTNNPQWQNPKWNWTLIYEYLKANPYDVLPQYSPYTDYATLQGFFLARYGSAQPFLFDDPSDDVVGPAIWQARTYYAAGAYIIDPSGHLQTALRNANTGAVEPSWDDGGGVTADSGQRWQDGGAFDGTLAQALPLVTDGSGGWYSPLQRNFGGQFLEDVTDLNTLNIPVTVWDNGVLPTNYSIQGPGLAIPGYSFAGMYVLWGTEPAGPITASFQFYFRVQFDMDTADFEEFLYQVWTVGGTDSKGGSGSLKLITSRVPGV